MWKKIMSKTHFNSVRGGWNGGYSYTPNRWRRHFVLQPYWYNLLLFLHCIKLAVFLLVMVGGAVSSQALDMTIVCSLVIAMDVIYNYNVPTYLNT